MTTKFLQSYENNYCIEWKHIFFLNDKEIKLQVKT